MQYYWATVWFRWVYRMATPDKTVEKRRDALLFNLLKTPPQPRPKRERDKSVQHKHKNPKKKTPEK